jgi:hypothetical protein
MQSQLTRMGMSRLADLGSWPSCWSRGLMMPVIAARLLGAAASVVAAWNTAALASLLRALARQWRLPDLDLAWTHSRKSMAAPQVMSLSSQHSTLRV